MLKREELSHATGMTTTVGLSRPAVASAVESLRWTCVPEQSSVCRAGRWRSLALLYAAGAAARS